MDAHDGDTVRIDDDARVRLIHQRRTFESCLRIQRNAG